MRGVCLAALAGVLLLSSCGGGEEAEHAMPPEPPEPRGALTWALEPTERPLDPLMAPDRSTLLIARQVHEPLVDRVEAPWDGPQPRRGLALAVSASADRQEWTVRLRRQVRFQDGTPANGAAVVANAARWRTTARGRSALPGLAGADAPRSSEVRLAFDRPVEDLEELLANPRLGLVSPRALEPRSGEGATLSPAASGTGTGPFELRELRDDTVLLVAHQDWWASRLGLGPGLAELRFRGVPAAARRAELLVEGEVQVASGLTGRTSRPVAEDPLSEMIGGRIGVERSVRGLRPGVRSLSSITVTRLGSM